MLKPRHQNLAVALAGLLLALFGSPVRSAPGAERPNFLIILCDDLGYGDLACYGNETIRTPSLDRLAAEGIRLTDCYAAAPVCSPSRAGLLTGRVPNRTGVYDWIPIGHRVHLPPSEITIATLLRDAGYDTCHVGKWHLNGGFNENKPPQPSDHGFEHWFSTSNNARPSHHNPGNFRRNGEKVGEIEGYACDIVVDEAIKWLREMRDADKPFFQFVCFHEPHEPVASPPDLVESYPQATKRGEALYYANVTNMDAAVGRLMAALDELKLAESTLVFFTSDNGPETLNRYQGAWRSHGTPGDLRGMKLHMYEGGIRVPGILRWKGTMTPGQVMSEPISGVDVLPTLCELAGIESPRDRVIDGSSFAPIIEGRPIERIRPLFWTYYRALGEPKACLREGDWKIVAAWDAPAAPVGNNVNAKSMQRIKSGSLARFELYNLRTDAAETTDVADSEPGRLATLREKIIRVYEVVRVEGPDWFAGESDE